VDCIQENETDVDHFERIAAIENYQEKRKLERESIRQRAMESYEEFY